jgi:hypothetical protein
MRGHTHVPRPAAARPPARRTAAGRPAERRPDAPPNGGRMPAGLSGAVTALERLGLNGVSWRSSGPGAPGPCCWCCQCDLSPVSGDAPPGRNPHWLTGNTVLVVLMVLVWLVAIPRSHDALPETDG